jgi:hypothetical protein
MKVRRKQEQHESDRPSRPAPTGRIDHLVRKVPPKESTSARRRTVTIPKTRPVVESKAPEYTGEPPSFSPADTQQEWMKDDFANLEHLPRAQQKRILRHARVTPHSLRESYEKAPRRSSPADTDDPVSAETRIGVAADLLSRVYPAEDVKEALEYLAAKAARETTSRSATDAPRLKWPDDALPHEIDSPPHFAARAYRAEAEAGTLHRGVIGRDDRAFETKLASKLSNWLRTHKWPEDVPYIPTKPEWDTLQLATLGRPPKATRIRTGETRLYEVARYRAAKPG